MLKKPYFEVLCFGEKYLIADVDIFTDTKNRKFLKNIKLTAEFVLNEGKKAVLDAKLFQFCINKIKFKLIISRFAPDVAVIGYPSWLSLNRFAKAQTEQSREENDKILKDVAKKHFVEPKDANVFCSPRKDKMFKIIPKDSVFTVECWVFDINMDAEITAVSIKNPYESLLDCFRESTSVYDSLESAKKYIQSQIKSI